MLTVTDGVTIIEPQLVLGYDVERRSNNIGHLRIDGTIDVSLKPAQLRRGTLQLFFLDEATAAACEALHARPARFTLSTDDLDTISMQYVLAPGGEIRRRLDAGRKRWQVDVEFQEVT